MLPITRASRALQRPLVVGRIRREFQLLPRYSSFGTGISHAQQSQSSGAVRGAPPPGEGAGAVEDVVVVGAGVGGLATAACLARIGLRVTVAAGKGGAGGGRDITTTGEKTKAAAESMDRSSRAIGGSIDPGVGIWTHGLACLESLGVLQQLESEGRYMGEAGYRDTAGNWLATPTRPLQEWGGAPMRRGQPCSDESGGKSEDGRLGGGGEAGAGGGGASVLFVRESKLMEALRSVLPADTKFVEGDAEDINWGCGASNDDAGVAGKSRGTVSGRFCAAGAGDGGWEADFDLLVGADGPQSFVRDRVVLAAEAGATGGRRGDAGCSVAGTGAVAGSEAAAAGPRRRGYTVYRGVCSSSSSSRRSSEGAPRIDEEGGWGLASFQTWGPGLRFASVPLAGDERMWFATVEDGLVGADGGPADKDQHFPSCGGGGGEGEGEQNHEKKRFLLETFGGWHAPVGSLLRATAEGSITREDARAMSRQGLRDIAAAASAARRRSRGGGGGGGVVLVGDAAHTLDPVLAQGAGVALEDAFFLAHHLKDFNDRQNKRSAAVTAGEAGDRLEEALSRYDEERLQRALLLSVLSDVSQALGQLRRPEWLVRARDSTLARYIPATLSSRVFDGLMEASLAGGLAGGARAAAAAAVGFVEKWRFGGYTVPKLW
ncbi:unnamed protein product [Ectocarpus sp. 12 AP-2014]